MVALGKRGGWSRVSMSPHGGILRAPRPRGSGKRNASRESRISPSRDREGAGIIPRDPWEKGRGRFTVSPSGGDTFHSHAAQCVSPSKGLTVMVSPIGSRDFRRGLSWDIAKMRILSFGGSEVNHDTPKTLMPPKKSAGAYEGATGGCGRFGENGDSFLAGSSGRSAQHPPASRPQRCLESNSFQ